MRRALRVSDQVGRYGGEEFIVILAQTTATGATVAAEHILQAMRRERLEIADQHLPVTVSIGAATVQPGDDTLEATVHRADAALYEAKTAGKDRAVCGKDEVSITIPAMRTQRHEGA